MKDCRKAFTSRLLEIAREDKDIIAVTSDARGSVTLGDFSKELPDQFVECGIAEQDAVGISAGLAHSGKKVFCCGPACFYVARSLEQVKVGQFWRDTTDPSSLCNFGNFTTSSEPSTITVG